MTYNSLGTCNLNLGDREKAESYYRKAIEFCRKAEGDDERYMATPLSNLANMYMQEDTQEKK